MDRERDRDGDEENYIENKEMLKLRNVDRDICRDGKMDKCFCFKFKETVNREIFSKSHSRPIVLVQSYYESTQKREFLKF
jgi:hypothetical protein